jgi:hypothetical protein
MVRKLSSKDFRARRLVLDADDFALNDGTPDPPPSDLISKEAWNGIMTLPGDVAIRTTSYQGTRIAILHELWSGWIGTIPRGGILAEAMLDSADDFEVALFNLLHGFYKQSIASLRNALEAIVLGCACDATVDLKKWDMWRGGAQIRFTQECDKLQSLSTFRVRENKACEVAGVGIFTPCKGSGCGAWARNLYQRLSKFAHARGDSANSELWKSNGPIYSPDGMRIAYHAYLETYSLLLLVAKLSAVDLKMPSEARILYKRDSRKQYLSPPFQTLCAFYKTELFPSQRR